MAEVITYIAVSIFLLTPFVWIYSLYNPKILLASSRWGATGNAFVSLIICVMILGIFAPEKDNKIDEKSNNFGFLEKEKIKESNVANKDNLGKEVIKENTVQKLINDHDSLAQREFSKYPSWRQISILRLSSNKLYPVASYDNYKLSDYSNKDLIKYLLDPSNKEYCITNSEQYFLFKSGKNIKYSIDEGNKECIIISGEWNDFYTDKPLTDINDIVVDRIVSLDDAWDSGAKNWHKSEIIKFVNDEENFVLASKKISKERNGETIEDWLPDDEYKACDFIKEYINKKNSYKFSYLDDEVDVITDWHGEEIKSSDGYEKECNFYGYAYKEGIISDTLYNLPIRN